MPIHPSYPSHLLAAQSQRLQEQGATTDQLVDRALQGAASLAHRFLRSEEKAECHPRTLESDLLGHAPAVLQPWKALS